MVINDFRHQVRIDLRGRVARGELGADVVSTLREQLAKVRQTLLE